VKLAAFFGTLGREPGDRVLFEALSRVNNVKLELVVMELLLGDEKFEMSVLVEAEAGSIDKDGVFCLES